MKTIVRKYCEGQEVITQGAEIIKRGGLVAFPTETVYGLGANALSPEAAKKIYTAKGRPSDNPLIVHIACRECLEELVLDVSQKAQILMDMFWPGPLTLIFKKRGVIPAATTGNLDTVAVRMPDNETALALIKASGSPIAAPSANKSGRPSPTSAAHVLEDMEGKIDMVIDGGNCTFGLESTIVDVSEPRLALLRPGTITAEMIINTVGHIDLPKESPHEPDTPRAPGMKYKHYAPKGEMTLVCGSSGAVSEKIMELAKNDMRKYAVIAADENIGSYRGLKNIFLMGSLSEPEKIGHNIFAILREMDRAGFEAVYAEGIEARGVGFAVMNRLYKASGYNVIIV